MTSEQNDPNARTARPPRCWKHLLRSYRAVATPTALPERGPAMMALGQQSGTTNRGIATKAVKR